MSMTYDEKELKKAIENDNQLWIKGIVMNCMWNDPAFEHGETEALLETLKRDIPRIFVPYEKVPSEERLERSAWDKDYFIDLTYYFRENFAESRIAHIKEVGKAVYQKSEKRQVEKENPKSPVAPKKEEKIESTKQEKPGNFHLTGMILAVIILVIILILLIRNLIK